MSYFGVVQYIGAARSADWQTYYEHMFDFSSIPDEERFGILPKGKLMKSPCGNFLWQLVEPEPWMDADDSPECLQRIGFGVPDVSVAVKALKAQGVASGDVLTIPIGHGVQVLELLALPIRRGPAPEARSHYRVLDGTGVDPIGAPRSAAFEEGFPQP
jgi:hypothetical protein